MDSYAKILAFWTGCNIPGASFLDMLRFQNDIVKGMKVEHEPSEEEVMMIASKLSTRYVYIGERRITRGPHYESYCHGVRMLLMYPRVSSWVISYEENKSIHIIQRTSGGYETVVISYGL
jgi:hypothetical protein